MQGTGVPMVTPFDGEAIHFEKLRTVVSWMIDSGIDFLVPCGSNGESELLSLEERANVIETVVEESSVPVLAGTGHPGFAETRKQTALAAEAGADGALVVTPYYYQHDQSTLASYYRRLADESDIPIYLYSVPAKTGVKLEPETVESLSTHKNIHGIKDSSGDLVTLQQEHRRVDEEFDLFIGHGSLYAQGLDVGIDGGILALANVVPDLATEIQQRHKNGDDDDARTLNADLVDLNQAITAQYGIPGVKAAMRERNVPAGTVRSPLEPLAGEARQVVERLARDSISK